LKHTRANNVLVSGGGVLRFASLIGADLAVLHLVCRWDSGGSTRSA
jgi:hypothetical protein